MLGLKDTLIIIVQNLAHDKEGKTKSGISFFFLVFHTLNLSKLKCTKFNILGCN